ncbi:hypothetical protein [Clostridium sp. KNHs214]|uniref:hypothetical protein n=1 Tax=Clostridium sp. KNHs214 TaxID=1540257 RepID=UPI000552CFA2|nr:hypothetical protein [Clostridium sp. KNHs214]
MENKDWEQMEFDRIFDSVYQNLKDHRRLVPEYSIKDLESFLETLYISDGNDWDGRGSVSSIKSNATIAACETFLAEWREVEKNN